VVSMATLEQMETPIPPAMEYGFGLEISETWRAVFGERVIGHSGANAGVYALWLYFPESRHTIFVALNRLDFSEPPLVDSGAIMLSIIYGVRDILWKVE